MDTKRAFRTFLSGILLAALSSVGRAQSATNATTAEPTPQQVEGWIAQLGDPKAAVRDEADVRLRKVGWAAMNSLAIANAQTKDAEIRSRLSSIILDLCINENGLTAVVSAEVREFMAADGPKRMSMDADMSRTHAVFPALEAVLLSTGKFDSSLGDSLRTTQNTIEHSLPSSPAAQGRFDWSLVVSALGHHSGFLDNSGGNLLYATHKNGDAYPIARTLLAILRNAPRTKERDFGLQSIEDLIIALLWTSDHLEEAATLPFDPATGGLENRALVAVMRDDWKTLAEGIEGARALDRAAAYQFLGQWDRADEILKYNGKPFEEDTVNVSGRHPMLLGRMDLSIRLFEDQQDSLDAGVFLLQQHRYHDTEALIKRANASGYEQAVALESQLIPALVHLNGIDRARTLAQKLGGEKDPMNSGWVSDAIEETQYRLGADLGISPSRPLNRENLFYPNDRQANAWAAVFGDDENSPPETLVRIGRILAHGPSAADESALVDRATKMKAVPRLDESDLGRGAAQLYINFYQVYLLKKTGHADLASKWLTLSLNQILPSYKIPAIMPNERVQYDPVFPLDAILSLKDWQFALPMLEKLGSADTADPVFSFLLGVCRWQLGDGERARRLMDSADERLAGDIPRRLYLATVLRAAGEATLAKNQAQLVSKISTPFSSGYCTAEEFLVDAAFDAADYSEARRHLRRVIVSRFHWGLLPEDRSIYIRIPRQSAFCDAMIATQINDQNAAQKAAELLPTLDPEDLDWTILIVHRMKSAGWNEQAKALVDAHRSALQKILVDFPGSHLHHYLIARLDIQTDYVNDQTAYHIARAVALAPANSDYATLEKQLQAQPPAR